jgi:hypothetical protein
MTLSIPSPPLQEHLFLFYHKYKSFTRGETKTKKLKKALDINVTERFMMILPGGMQDGIHCFEAIKIGRDQHPHT